MRASAKTIIEYRVYDLPLDLPVIVLQGDQWHISDELSNRLHFHNCLEIGFCHSKSGTLTFEGEVLPFIQGDVTIIPRHIPHTTCSTKGTKSLWSYLFIDLEGILGNMASLDKQHAIGAEDAMAQGYVFSATSHPRIHFITTAMLEEFQTQRSNWLSVVKGLVLLLQSELLRLNDDMGSHKTDKSNKSFVLKPALDYIRHSFMNQTTMQELADMCHLSETHFRRTFLSIMGTSPLSFINTTRISKACILLDTTDLSILAIAEAVGINSISSFNRNFKQKLGINPRDYRNKPSKSNLSPKQKYILTYKGWMAAEDRPEHVGATIGRRRETQKQSK